MFFPYSHFLCFSLLTVFPCLGFASPGVPSTARPFSFVDSFPAGENRHERRNSNEKKLVNPPLIFPSLSCPFSSSLPPSPLPPFTKRRHRAAPRGSSLRVAFPSRLRPKGQFALFSLESTLPSRSRVRRRALSGSFPSPGDMFQGTSHAFPAK